MINIDETYIGKKIIGLEFYEEYTTFVLFDAEEIEVDIDPDNDHEYKFIGRVIEEIRFEEFELFLILDNGIKIKTLLKHEDIELPNCPSLIVKLHSQLNKSSEMFPQMTVPELMDEFDDLKNAFNAIIGKNFTFMGKTCFVLNFKDYNDLTIRILFKEVETKVIHVSSLR